MRREFRVVTPDGVPRAFETESAALAACEGIEDAEIWAYKSPSAGAEFAFVKVLNPVERRNNPIPRPYRRIERADGDRLKRRAFWLLDSEMEIVKEIGDGNSSEGVRRLLAPTRAATPRMEREKTK